MPLAAFRAQLHLSLSFAETGAVGIRIVLGAMRACHTRLKPGRGAVGLGQRTPAGVAVLVRPLNEAGTDRDATIKNKAFPVKKIVYRRDCFKVTEDTAVQVKDLGNALAHQVSG